MKKCKICGVEQTLSNTEVQTVKGKVYLRRICRSCKAIGQREHNWKRQGIQGMSLSRYEELYAAQNGKCAICNTTFVDKTPCVDHNHTTGEVRGLLCTTCNAGLGLFKDDLALLYSAKHYLEMWK